VHEHVRRLRGIIDSYEDRLLIGEVYLPLGELVRYYGIERSGVHLPFNFQLIQHGWKARDLRRIIDEYEGSVGADDWPNWVLGNHDQPRVASRIGREQARVAAMLLLTLRGTPVLYNGDELGLVNGDIKREDMRDPRARSCDGRGIGRDPFRTPMQWDAEPCAGFTTGTPWLPMAGDHGDVHVEAQRGAPDSMLALHHDLLALRRGSAALQVGDYYPVPVETEDVLVYARVAQAEAYLVALNLGDVARVVSLPASIGDGRIELSIREPGARGRRTGNRLELAPNDGAVIRLDEPPRTVSSTLARPRG
jgi:alpha-glucosidase